MGVRQASLEGNLMDPCYENKILFRCSQQLPHLKPLKGLLSSEGAQNYRETTTCCAALGVEVPGQNKGQLLRTTMVSFFKTSKQETK